jgi:hypothetical protein
LPSISSSPRKPPSRPLHQYKPQRDVQTEGREHCRNAEMSHLIYPIVMMTMHPAWPQYPMKHPPQPTPSHEEGMPHSRPSLQIGQMPTPQSPRPVDLSKGPHSWSHPFDQRPTPTRPKAACPQNAWPVATGSKRQASGGIRSAYYDELKKPRISGAYQSQGNVEYAAMKDGSTEMGTSPSSFPTSEH